MSLLASASRRLRLQPSHPPSAAVSALDILPAFAHGNLFDKHFVRGKKKCGILKY